MWDEDDYTARWVQGICAIVLAIAAVGGLYMVFNATLSMIMFGGIAVTLGCIRLCWRCARYAFTGKGNVNRDDF